MIHKKKNEGFLTINFMLGILIAMGVVFVSFEWSKTEIRTIMPNDFSDDIFMVIEQIPITYPNENTKALPPLPKYNPLAFEVVEEVVLDIPEDFEINDIVTSNIELVDIPINTAEKYEEPLPIVQYMPSFPGGEDALMSFLSNNIKYPELAREYSISGKVYVQFIIEKDGTISNIVLAKSVDKTIDEEAIRVVTLMPKWKPGFNNGRYVRVRMTLPINFILQ